MPRLPVDGKRVIEHRITFGTKEREMIDSAIAAYQFNKVATPVVAGMSDVSFMVALAGLLALYFPDINIPVDPKDPGVVVDSIQAGIDRGMKRAEEERLMTGEATLDDSSGPTDFVGRILYNLRNPNWSRGGPGFREAWAEGPGRFF
jgi:hypothetical protein